VAVPYAFRLKAFFIPAIVSLKSTCWLAMLGELLNWRWERPWSQIGGQQKAGRGSAVGGDAKEVL
jgi:hypothetical protein